MMKLLPLVCLFACSATSVPEPVWTPGTALPSVEERNARGLLDRRGLVHAHSVYSHDACDGKPVIDGQRNEPCFEDFRRDLCTSRHDFVMLSDHQELFTTTEFPDTLLFSERHGDGLVMRGGAPVANRAGCPDGSSALVLAGSEAGTLLVGLEHHVEGRGDVYGKATPEAIAKLKEAGAVVLMAHTEEWDAETLATWPLDGFEMFNLHANTFLNMGKALSLLGRLWKGDEGLPHPDLVFLTLASEDPAYLSRWGSVLAKGVRRVTTMGTDCHRNTFEDLMSDGERVDSYRRMMMWFSNHLLVRPKDDGTWDDLDLKDALRAGRLYGAFEVMGYPEGFDYRAEAEGRVYEMGEEVALAQAPVLKVAKPSIRRLDPRKTPPETIVRILKAVDGGFDEVARGESSLEFVPSEPGAYRAEVRLRPLHLREDLGDDADDVLSGDFPWIYSNPVYVR